MKFKILKRKGKNAEALKSPIEMLSNVKFKVGYVDIVFEKGIRYDLFIEILKDSKIHFNGFAFEDFGCDDVTVINTYTFENMFSLRNYIYVYEKEECNLWGAYNISISDMTLTTLNNLFHDLEGLKLLSNYNVSNNVSVKTSTFFNSVGTDCYFGGAERYLLDLYGIFQDKGVNLNIYQLADKPFFRKIFGINVIGLYSPEKKEFLNHYLSADFFTKNYIYRTYYNSQLHIYSSFQECYPNHLGPSIGISHGISWDSSANHYSYGMENFWENKKKFLDSIYYCDKVISVDTNTPNWVQTVDYEMSKKLVTIPNYVDTNQFKKNVHNHKNIIITFPRRLYEPRGLYLILDIVPDLLDKYKNLEIHFVGRGNSKDTGRIDDVIKQYPKHVKRYSKEPYEMANVYQNSDISLIPTLYSEGTSLSCLEAMASGNIVVATRVGGLTDLIINNYNGYLIEPNKEALKEALFNIIDNYDKQDEIRENAVAVSKVFNKDVWSERWNKQLADFDLNKTSDTTKLIEIYLNSLNSFNTRISDIIMEYLIKGYLIYIRLQEYPDEDNISNGLLQLLRDDETIVSEAEKIYVDSSYTGKIERKEKVEFIK